MGKLNSETDILTFQCKDIVSRDVFVAKEDDESDGSRGSNDKVSNRKFQILLFGSDPTGHTVCLQVENFKPYFYVRIPSSLYGNRPVKTAFLQWLMNGVPPAAAEEIDLQEEKHQVLFDFTNGQLASFYKITVPSQAIWRLLKNKLLSKSTSEPVMYETRSIFGKAGLDKDCLEEVHALAEDGKRVALKIYEANIDPVLRFFHIQNITPAGWIQVKANAWSYADSNDAKVSLYAACEWNDVFAGADIGMAPYLVASWDIECNSSHGDFPIAKKTWRKPLRELIDVGKVPESLDELCDLLSEAIDSASSVGLSPIYLQVPRRYLGETLRLMLEGKDMAWSAGRHLVEVRAGGANRDQALTNLDKVLTAVFPKVAGDEIIQIGTVLYCKGQPVSKHIWVLGTVDEAGVKPPGQDVPITVYGYTNEATLLRAWFEWIGRKQPDVMIGYNIFGFDSKYIWDRIEETVGQADIKNLVAPLSCLRTRPPKLEEKFLSSSAMGDNTMWFISSAGRLQIDLLPYIRRNHNLDSYSLDNVSATFVSGDSKGLQWSSEDDEICTILTKSTKGLSVGRYITLMDEENDRIVEKCQVVAVSAKSLTVRVEGGKEFLADQGMPVRWAQVKDDVKPKDIFRLHRGTAQDRAIVARYCLQDCDLVMELFHKLEILNNSVAMATVCSVPVSYIFLRGQGIKIESLIFKECRIADQLIEVMPSQGFQETLELKPLDGDEDKPEEEDSYEGAIVLEPKTGIYIDDPITADDFASLYPSSIISENISHDTLISVKDYDLEDRFVCVKEGSDKYDNLPGASYVNIAFDILRPDPSDTRKHPEKRKTGTRIARYIQKPQGTIPRILEMLLASRKKCRKQAETEPDEFRKALLDAQQLAYKLTANSLYGQLGSGTFKIRRQVLAASTTAYGRMQLMYAKAVIERLYGGGADPRCDVECIYGDTDSIFLRFRPKDPLTGKRLTGKAALVAAKALTVESGKLVSSCLKPPHDFEFDKIFKSFCLLSKKRYVGDMSEDGLEDDDFHRKSMGIVMKRRDNAPIVKYVYRKAIDTILNPVGQKVGNGVKDAATIVQSIAKDLLQGKFPLSKLTITKSLRAEYKDPLRIAHKVLADRIGERDPGNKPSTSDRIPYVYIASKGPVPKLQGDRIELPSYIKEKGLKPDYAFYITNQIAKPVAQVFGLAVEHMPGVKPSDVDACRKAKDPVAAAEKLAESILFQKALLEAARDPTTMEARGQRSIASMFL